MTGSAPKKPSWLNSILQPPKTTKLVEVDPTVTTGAERDQVLLGIVSQVASRLEMMNLQPSKRPTELAAPPVVLKVLPPKFSIGNRIQPQPRPLLSKPVFLVEHQSVG
jgi:hypothetical protein